MLKCISFYFVNTTTHIPAYATLVVGVLADSRSLEVVRHFIIQYSRGRGRGMCGMAIAVSPAFGCSAVAVCARRAQCEIFRPSFSLPGTAYRRRRLMADWKQGTDLLFSTRTVVLPIFRVQRCVPFSPSSFRCSCSRRRRPSPQNSVVRSSAAPGEP